MQATTPGLHRVHKVANQLLNTGKSQAAYRLILWERNHDQQRWIATVDFRGLAAVAATAAESHAT